MIKNCFIFFLGLFSTICSFGQEFEWAVSTGGNSSDFCPSIASDQSGNLYYLNYFQETIDADPGSGVLNITATDQVDFCISKINALGNLVWVKQVGGNGSQLGYSICVHNSGEIYITGILNGTGDFDPGPATYPLTSVGSSDIFAMKLDTSGNFIWAKRVGSTDVDTPYDVCTDQLNNIYITGEFGGTVDFDPGPGTFNMTGNDDAFIVKYDTAGNFIWAKKIGALTTEARGNSIAVDSSGHVYTIGTFDDGTVDFDPGAGIYNLTTIAFSIDVFILKLDSDGNFLWAHRFGGNSPDDGVAIAVDSAGTVFATGVFAGTVDFDPGPAVYNLVATGSKAIFVLKLNSAGSFNWANKLGGITGDEPTSISLDSEYSVYTIGSFSGTSDFDPTAGVFNVSSTGGKDIFMSKLDSAGGFTWVKTWGGIANDAGNDIATNAFGEVFFAGVFDNVIDFEEGAGTTILNGSNYMDIVIHKQSSDTIFSNLSVIGCGSYTVPSGDETYNFNGVYNDTITTLYGCENILTISLVFGAETTNAFNVTECTFYTVPSGDETYFVSGIYLDTLTNSSGCDSLMTINATIIPPTLNSILVQECSSYTVPSGDETYLVSGTYMDTIMNSINCDSILTIDLQILNNTGFIQLDNVCDSLVSPSGNYIWTSSGIYSDTIQNVSGCDSIITIDLGITHSSISALNIVQCSAYLSPGGSILSTSGVYTDTIANAAGCDSIITINLTVNSPTSSDLYIDACDYYLSPSGNYTWTSDGLYTDIIQNSVGCDSVMTIHLNINYVNNNVTWVSGVALVALESDPGTTYQWLDCDDGFIEITGAIQQSITPTVNGSYAVQVTANGCTDTSQCFVIDWLSSPDKILDVFNVYPNPSNGKFTVKLGSNLTIANFYIMDGLGEIIYQDFLEQGEPLEFELANGIYYLKIMSDHGIQIIQLIIAK